ncbi:MAG: hypothetical protein E7273_07815 [Pseudobutyrivibrio ruminis]|nr:hypothetical protein [Pseudobutyrivibrio ruminis]
MRQLTREKKYSLVYYILFTIITIGLFVKAKYGFADVDEPFFLSIPLRMINGDKLFLHEWNLSQLTGLLLYPFVKIYLMIFKSTDGILLNFRYIYVCVQAISCILLFNLLKKYSKAAAICFSLILLLYTPLNVMTLCYNTLGILFMNFTAVLILDEDKKYRFFIAGILFACGCLCNPYAVVIYICVLICILFKRNKAIRKSKLQLLGNFTLGALIILGITLICIFSRISINEFITSVHEILTGDLGHTGELWKKPITFLLQVFAVYTLGTLVYIIYIPLIILARKAEMQVRNKYAIAAIILAAVNVVFVLQFIKPMNYNVNAYTMPISGLGLCLALMYWDKLNHSYFYKIWLPGALYAFTLHVASDNGIATITIAGTVMMMASLLYLADVYKIIEAEGTINQQKMAKYACFVLIALQIGFMSVFRWIGIYWDKPITYQNTLINKGPEAGIIASEDRANTYNQIYDEIMSLDSDKKTLFFTSRTWLYDLQQFENCSFSAWIWHISPDTVARFARYYEINPDKKPEVVYIDQDNANLAGYWVAAGYEISEQTASGGYVLQLVNNNE